MRAVEVAAFTALLIGVSVGVASGQDGSATAVTDALATADSLSRSGRTEEAREWFVAWWDAGRSEASRSELEHATWLRAVLTVDPEQARVEYRRLVVEFPGGPHAAPALARIARMLAAAGDTAGARDTWETLLREHPGSEESATAEAWLGSAPPGDGVEAEGSAPLDLALQLGAFSSLVRARELTARAREAGLEPRMVRVRGSDLIRVRLGRFGSEADAEELHGQIRALGFDALIVDGAEREEAVGSDPGAV